MTVTQGFDRFVTRAAIVLLLLLLLGLLAYWHGQNDPGEVPETYEADSTLLTQLGEAKLADAPAPQPAGDWPQWRGLHRDGISSETGLLRTWPTDGPALLWKVKGGPGHSSLAVAGGRVYTLVEQDGDDEVIVCLDALTGADVWRVRYPGRFHEQYAGTGPHATPTVHDGRVYAVGAMGMLHCLDAALGTLLWKHNLGEMFKAPPQVYGMSCSPLIEGDLVITLPGGTDGACIVAFDRRDGRLVWKTGNDQPGYSSPIAATLAGKRQLVVVTGESVMGLAPVDGAVFWRFPWKECNIATPIAVGDYVFVSTGYSKGCALLHIAPRGAEALEVSPVYQHNRMRNHFSTSVLCQDHFYGFDEAFLVCMELRTGKILWKERKFQKGSLLLGDGLLIVLGENGVLALVEPNPRGYRENASFRLTESRCWAMPVVAAGRLYVRDQEHIFCLDLRVRE